MGHPPTVGLAGKKSEVAEYIGSGSAMFTPSAIEMTIRTYASLKTPSPKPSGKKSMYG
jgi:hypothetical protein